VVRYPRSEWEGKRGNSAHRKGCMCGYWQGGGGMGCRRRLGCEGGAGVVGQGGRKVLCRFEKITALEVVTGNVNVGGLSTIIVGQVQRG